LSIKCPNPTETTADLRITSSKIKIIKEKGNRIISDTIALSILSGCSSIPLGYFSFNSPFAFNIR